MENEKDTALTFGVGLNKNEYVIFQKTMARFTAGKRFSKVLSAAVVMFAVFTVRDALKQGVQALKGIYFLSTLGFLAVLFLCTTVFPAIGRHFRAVRGYDDAIAGGQIFDGMVTVNTEGITKVTESGSVMLSFDRDLLFLERKDMFIFINRFGQGIVLPARCLTAEDADAVRETAKRYIQPRFVMNKGTLVPQAKERLQLKEVSPLQVLYTFTVQYEEAEHKAFMKTLMKRDILRTAPLTFLFCFLLSVSIAIDNGFTTAAVAFWIAVVLFAGLKLLFWLPRYKRANKNAAPLTVTLNEKAVVVEKKAQPVPHKVILQWKDIAHAVESEETVEIYNQRQYIYIPKRCVGDMDFLRNVVNEKMNARERNV